MPYDESKLVNLQSLKETAERIKTEYRSELEKAGAGSVYEAVKDDLETADAEVIQSAVSTQEITPKKGDVFIITTTVDETSYEQSAYIYDGEKWVAVTGRVDAEKVILRDDITMAGNYTQVGNLTKAQNGTGTLSAKGRSVAQVLTDIFSKRLQPTVTAQPSVSGFALSGAGAVEAGTKVAKASYGAATLSPGSYTYGPATGVTATKWVVQRVTNSGNKDVATVDAASLVAGTDDNGGSGFVIGDAGGENAVSSLKYKVTATHGAGVTANDNLGAPSEPPIAVAAGTKSKETSAYTPYRNYFYGATADKPALDSAYIRGLTKSGKAYAAGSVTVQVAPGTQRVCIACIDGKTGVKKVVNQTAMNADVTETFIKTTVAVEGAESYTAKDYNVWTYEPAKPYESAATLVVTLG